MAQTDLVPQPAPPHEAEAVPAVSVVVCVYDEQRTVGELYRRTAAALDELAGPAELIFVDDGSTDGTFAELSRLHEADARVRAWDAAGNEAMRTARIAIRNP